MVSLRCFPGCTILVAPSCASPREGSIASSAEAARHIGGLGGSSREEGSPSFFDSMIISPGHIPTEPRVPGSNPGGRAYNELTRREALFWSHVDRSAGPDACWPWRGSLFFSGYGQVAWRIGGVLRRFRAHRLALLFVCGPEGLGQEGAHACHNRVCCNPHPSHVHWATHAENMAETRAARARAREAA